MPEIIGQDSVVLATEDAESHETILKGPGPNRGESSAAARGRQAHADQEYSDGYMKEYTLDSGKRVDAASPSTRHIIELKPNNPRAIRLGERQITTDKNWQCKDWRIQSGG